MEILDYKIKNEDFNNRDIMGLPDKPSEAGMSAATLKERFDAAVKYIVAPKLNALIDSLAAADAGDVSVDPIDGVSGLTVQAVMEWLKALIDTKIATEEAQRQISTKFEKTEAQKLFKNIAFDDSTGIFTFTRYDDSIVTFDTVIEKVLLDVRLDGQDLVLTLADGSEQRTSLSNFLTQTETKDSDTVGLAEEAGILVARVQMSSITKAHLASDVTEYIEAKESAVAASQQAAAVSEANALLSQRAAAEIQQAVLTCQNNACACATEAESSANAAASSAVAAAESMSYAQAEANRAAEEANRAEQIAGGNFYEYESGVALESTVENLQSALQSISDNIGCFFGDDDTKYRWGKNEIGVYYEDVVDSNAPAAAGKNIIVGVQKNGVDLTPNATTRTVNITVPTKTRK